MTYNEAILELVKIQDTMMVARNDNKRLEIKILPLHTKISTYTNGVRTINMEHVANYEYIIKNGKRRLTTMTHEEKLQEAKRLYKSANSDQRYVLESLFPELAESEEERIRKEFCKDIWTFIPNEKAHKYIAWLEKQGENVSLPKFTFDDVLALQCCMETTKKVQEDKELYEQLQSLHDRLHDAYWLEKQGEQKPTDEEMKTLLRTEYEKGRADAIAEMQKEGLSEDNPRVIKYKEELREKKMISLKDACKWLSDNRDHPFIGCEDPCLSGYLTDEFIEDFRKTMEEQIMDSWLKSLKQRIGG